MEIEDVVLASTAAGRANLSKSVKTSSFSSASSGTASMRKSASREASSIEPAVSMRWSAASRIPGSIFPCATPSSSAWRIHAMPVARFSGITSSSIVRYPPSAAAQAMPRPVLPAPMTAIVFTSIGTATFLPGEEPRGVLVKDFPLCLLADGQRGKLFEIAFDFGNAGAGPVRSPQHFLGNFFEARKILKQFLRRDAGDVHVHVFVAADEEECLFHPERAPAVREDQGEPGEINGDIV